MRFGNDTLQTRRVLELGAHRYHYYSLQALIDQGREDVRRLPCSLKVLLENLLRFEDGNSVTTDHVDALIARVGNPESREEIAYRPARVLMQDLTGVPAVVDLASMRDAMAAAGEDPARINPLSQVDLVIDHSVMVDAFASADAYRRNVDIEMQRNGERYRFLRWGQAAFDNFRVVPPGTGICHQVNLEYLAQVTWSQTLDDETWIYPDTLVGLDSHTTMINALGVLGWGVGGIEAEAAMLGQPVSMLIPEVVGFELAGRLREGVTATDLVLTVTEMLRRHGVVGKFVEFFGAGLADLPIADRATIANMAPEYGATCGFFPVDDATLDYLRLTGREAELVERVERYSKAQGLWRDDDAEIAFSNRLRLDLDQVVPSLAGPKRPQDRVALPDMKAATDAAIEAGGGGGDGVAVDGADYRLDDGDVVIAAITSCTNTSNPAVMLAAGLVAQKAVELGLERKPWVKTSLAPGSKVVTDYLAAGGYDRCLDQLGFNLVGYGCTTCIGNSGPLPAAIEKAIDAGNLTVCSVLSGNRNFEGRIHQKVRANWLASPPLVVIYALAGTTRIDLQREPLGNGKDGAAVYLKDIWPTNDEIQAAMAGVTSDMFSNRYAAVFDGDQTWRDIAVRQSSTYPWDDRSTYIRHPPFFAEAGDAPDSDVDEARILALLGDSITTDHISPAGAIALDSPAGSWLIEQGVEREDFNSYGSRRGNHEVMMRGTFANIRIRNEMVPGTEGGVTVHAPSGDTLSIYDAAMAYRETGTPLVVIAGKEYGTGSSRDWAAKGTRLLGVRAVIAESYERIHRSNLIGMGVLPLQFNEGDGRKSLGLDGSEKISLRGLSGLRTGGEVAMRVDYADGRSRECTLLARIDTDDEMAYFRAGGILHYVLRQLRKQG